MAKEILSVSQINEYIRAMMDRDGLLCSVAVRGEISNYKVYPSGHHYFTIKDTGAALKCVMFKSSAVKLRFRPDNGMQVIVMGKISVYPRDGAYQMYCAAMVLDGVGDLHAAFEQLKAKLGAQGLFDPAHKQPLPHFPGTIGIITSSAGAAVHDMLRILRKRYPLTKVRLLPVRVQGAEAPGEIVAAIQYANHHRLADLLIVGRGGGSIEDLWAFNDERVAYAIFQSKIPIISAVGHEPDVTISDYVADLRAATPSNAAELAVPDQDALRQTLDAFSVSMASSFGRQLKNAKRQLSMLASSNTLRSPDSYLKLRRDALGSLSSRFAAACQRNTDRKRQRFVGLAAKLDAMSPLKVLTRGYALTQKADGTVLRSVKQTAAGESLRIVLADGQISATVAEIKENQNESKQ